MSYKNPIPSLDDKYVSKVYCITFNFEIEVTQDEATEAINAFIAEEYDGKIPKEWVRAGKNKILRLSTDLMDD